MKYGAGGDGGNYEMKAGGVGFQRTYLANMGQYIDDQLNGDFVNNVYDTRNVSYSAMIDTIASAKIMKCYNNNAFNIYNHNNDGDNLINKGITDITNIINDPVNDGKYDGIKYNPQALVKAGAYTAWISDTFGLRGDIGTRNDQDIEDVLKRIDTEFDTVIKNVSNGTINSNIKADINIATATQIMITGIFLRYYLESIGKAGQQYLVDFNAKLDKKIMDYINAVKNIDDMRERFGFIMNKIVAIYENDPNQGDATSNVFMPFHIEKLHEIMVNGYNFTNFDAMAVTLKRDQNAIEELTNELKDYDPTKPEVNSIINDIIDSFDIDVTGWLIDKGLALFNSSLMARGENRDIIFDGATAIATLINILWNKINDNIDKAITDVNGKIQPILTEIGKLKALANNIDLEAAIDNLDKYKNLDLRLKSVEAYCKNVVKIKYTINSNFPEAKTPTDLVNNLRQRIDGIEATAEGIITHLSNALPAHIDNYLEVGANPTLETKINDINTKIIDPQYFNMNKDPKLFDNVNRIMDDIDKIDTIINTAHATLFGTIDVMYSPKITGVLRKYLYTNGTTSRLYDFINVYCSANKISNTLMDSLTAAIFPEIQKYLINILPPSNGGIVQRIIGFFANIFTFTTPPVSGSNQLVKRILDGANSGGKTPILANDVAEVNEFVKNMVKFDNALKKYNTQFLTNSYKNTISLYQELCTLLLPLNGKTDTELRTQTFSIQNIDSSWAKDLTAADADISYKVFGKAFSAVVDLADKNLSLKHIDAVVSFANIIRYYLDKATNGKMYKRRTNWNNKACIFVSKIDRTKIAQMKQFLPKEDDKNRKFLQLARNTVNDVFAIARTNIIAKNGRPDNADFDTIAKMLNDVIHKYRTCVYPVDIMNAIIGAIYKFTSNTFNTNANIIQNVPLAYDSPINNATDALIAGIDAYANTNVYPELQTMIEGKNRHHDEIANKIDTLELMMLVKGYCCKPITEIEMSRLNYYKSIYMTYKSLMRGPNLTNAIPMVRIPIDISSTGSVYEEGESTLSPLSPLPETERPIVEQIMEMQESVRAQVTRNITQQQRENQQQRQHEILEGQELKKLAEQYEISNIENDHEKHLISEINNIHYIESKADNYAAACQYVLNIIDPNKSNMSNPVQELTKVLDEHNVPDSQEVRNPLIRLRYIIPIKSNYGIKINAKNIDQIYKYLDI